MHIISEPSAVFNRMRSNIIRSAILLKNQTKKQKIKNEQLELNTYRDSAFVANTITFSVDVGECRSFLSLHIYIGKTVKQLVHREKKNIFTNPSVKQNVPERSSTSRKLCTITQIQYSIRKIIKFFLVVQLHEHLQINYYLL